MPSSSPTTTPLEPSLWRILEGAELAAADRIAMVDGDLQLTYAQLGQRVRSLAARLQSQGVGPGDRVAILGVNSEPFWVSYFALAGLGAIAAPLNVRLSPAELAGILRDAGARWLLVDGTLAGLVAELTAERTPLQGLVWFDPPDHDSPASLTTLTYAAIIAEAAPEFEPCPGDGDEPAQLYYTSGTTGEPKGVVLTHRNVWLHAEAAIAELDLGAADRWAHVAPMFHLADAWAVFAMTRVNARHVMLRRFGAAQALALFAEQGITVTNLIPTMLNLMLKHPALDSAHFPALRLLLSGGAPIAPAVVEGVIDRFGCDYIQTYGLTETSPYVTLSKLNDRLRALPLAERLGYQAKTGRPMQGVHLRIVDGAGQSVAADDQQVGEIEVRGPTVTPGYWRNPAATASAFRDGWLQTGDLAVWDAEGFVNIVDRKKDVIITGGENVYSTEVEHVIYRHPAVLEAAVVGLPDETWGERVMAAVVRREGEGLEAEALRDHCRQSLAGFKVPREVVFLDALPRTGSGKIRKATLRERLGSVTAD